MSNDLRYLPIAELRIRPAIYHSQQTPGWISWCSILSLHNGELIVGFNEVTGNINRQKPEYLPEIRKNAFPNDFYNFTGLNNKFKIISAKNKETWLNQWDNYYEEDWSGPWPPAHNILLQTTMGTLLRETQGRRIPQQVNCGVISRSEDNGKTWSKYSAICDPDEWHIYVSRILQLRDGRLLMAAEGMAANVPGGYQWSSTFWLTSEDDGRSWSKPLPAITSDGSAGYYEPAVAELRNGDILMMVRVQDLVENNPLDAHAPLLKPSRNRKQVILKKISDKWVPYKIETLGIPHGGHPELLMTEQGILLYISAEGFWGTCDEGNIWTGIETLPPAPYYPRAVQLDDGIIIVVGHNGGDCPYPPPEDMMIWKVSFRINRLV
jgi:hypothetical protein